MFYVTQDVKFRTSAMNEQLTLLSTIYYYVNTISEVRCNYLFMNDTF